MQLQIISLACMCDSSLPAVRRLFTCIIPLPRHSVYGHSPAAEKGGAAQQRRPKDADGGCGTREGKLLCESHQTTGSPKGRGVGKEAAAPNGGTPAGDGRNDGRSGCGRVPPGKPAEKFRESTPHRGGQGIRKRKQPGKQGGDQPSSWWTASARSCAAPSRERRPASRQMW